jgi:hypothetical protein
MTESSETTNVNDADLIEILLHYFPGVQEILIIAQRVRNDHGFPVQSFCDLERSLGGPQTIVKFAGKTLEFSSAERFVPSYYFPITNERDLIAKLVELHRSARYQLRLQKERHQELK